jgi:type II secretory pathway pseudopilin PulG
MTRARRSPARREAGFTFVEVFAALVFLAILVPAVVEGLLIANRASVAAERGSAAGELAENKLNELLLSSTSGQTAVDTQGDFGTDWPGYRWQTSQQTWDQDNVNTMTQLSVEVDYPVQGKERSVTLTTLISLSGSTQSQSNP